VIVDAGGGDVGVAEPFLDLGDVGLVVEGTDPPVEGDGIRRDGASTGFAVDSPLEEAGFELAVPRRIVTLILVFAYVTPST
jgi:hypothetical protein